MAIMVGAQFGHYGIRMLLSAGGMVDVFLWLDRFEEARAAFRFSP